MKPYRSERKKKATKPRTRRPNEDLEDNRNYKEKYQQRATNKSETRSKKKTRIGKKKKETGQHTYTQTLPYQYHLRIKT